ncbi:Mis12-Mtw1 protein family-domain-containing protein [Scheffersomyces amazonensis]|uniref:Mis12-Mtw1 protein family-domain-containing protein n=1 Tax=Scheffersomyces amazonensis TaxID=1078765 RepID=UPI00315D6255
MAPKKKPVAKKQVSVRPQTTGKRSGPKLGSKNDRISAKFPSLSPPRNHPGVVSDSDDEPMSQPSSQSVLGRKNRLNDLLSSTNSNSNSNSNSKSKPKPKPKPSTTSSASASRQKRIPKTNQKYSFEEDEGFIYKRSQSVETDTGSGANGSKRKRKPISTPVSRLHDEIHSLSRDMHNDEDLHLLDLHNPKRSKTTSTTITNPKKRQSRKIHNFLDESSIQLSSPIQDRGHYSDEDDYVEQVSHHTLTLDEPVSKTGDKQNSKRRTSYYNRGKRVSSIGNGFVGEPHQDVPVSDYYKLLDTSLPEPDRVRQLLIWSFKKRLQQEENNNSKSGSTEDQTVLNIAKVIKEEVVRDLVEKLISISWYSNLNLDTDDTLSKEVRIPNPLNEINLHNIDVYSKKLKALIKQKQEWQDAYKRAIQPIEKLPETITSSVNKDQLEQYLLHQKEEQVDASILDNSYLESVDNNLEQVKEKIGDNLESGIDKLYHTTYQMSKVSEIVQAIETTKLKDQVSSLLSDYMTRRNDTHNSVISKPLPLYDISSKPTKSIDNKVLLRTLSRLGQPLQK